MSDTDLHAIRLWLDWNNQFGLDDLEPYSSDNITQIDRLYEVQVRTPYGQHETHHLTRVYLDDELGYIELFYIDRAGQVDLLIVQADTDWLCIKATNHTKEN